MNNRLWPFRNIDLEVALRKLDQLAKEDGDLGAEYWDQISQLLRAAASFRERAHNAEEELERIRTWLRYHPSISLFTG